MDELNRLLQKAKRRAAATESDREAQRRSFAYGNTKIENDRITRQLVDKAADELKDKDSKPLPKEQD